MVPPRNGDINAPPPLSPAQSNERRSGHRCTSNRFTGVSSVTAMANYRYRREACSSPTSLRSAAQSALRRCSRTTAMVALRVASTIRTTKGKRSVEDPSPSVRCAACASNQLTTSAQAWLHDQLGRALRADIAQSGTTKRQVAAMFADSAPASPRPAGRAVCRVLPRLAKRVIHLDNCREVARAYYAPPPGWIRPLALLRCSGRSGTCSCSIRKCSALLREHSRPSRSRADTAYSRRIDHRARRPASALLGTHSRTSAPPPAR